MNEAWEPVVAWFDGNVNRQITIRKEEDGDIDEVQLYLDRIQQVHADTIDGYTAKDRLLLIGSGTISAASSQEPIPGGVYEVPLTGSEITQQSESGLVLSSDRCKYTVHLHS
ncbi:hypothetical protein [Paenibacillus gansuensis]|uniref:Uncharacterized protein n=1 Tax=Paenibacillus gansuensis TaxID=306542 RepID=A0ABW5PHL7_9BACL